MSGWDASLEVNSFPLGIHVIFCLLYNDQWNTYEKEQANFLLYPLLTTDYIYLDICVLQIEICIKLCKNRCIYNFVMVLTKSPFCPSSEVVSLLCFLWFIFSFHLDW